MAYAFIRRIIGAALFDPATYEEVEADTGATPQAGAVAVCVFAWALSLAVALVIGLLFGPTLSTARI
jgi:hypothetical protein